MVSVYVLEALHHIDSVGKALQECLCLIQTARGHAKCSALFAKEARHYAELLKAGNGFKEDK